MTLNNHDDPSFPKILERTIRPSAKNNKNNNLSSVLLSFDDASPASPRRQLRLALFACEPNPPYGPSEHTAQLFLDLLTLCLEQDSHTTTTIHFLVLEVYKVYDDEYPRDYSKYHGFILPGSFSAAYDDSRVEWISKLQSVIQNELVAQQQQRPILGICFGHQLLSHSFKDNNGRAIKTPSGSRAGKQTMHYTRAGKCLFGDEESAASSSCDLFVSHGDMVQSLPSTALNLGGCEQVPIQAAAYFASVEEANNAVAQNGRIPDSSKPFAITFQAHPEYASSRELGLKGTLFPCMDAMVSQGTLTKEQRLELEKEAMKSFASIQRQSIHVMTTACQLLGWIRGPE
jgi:GMP synthase-like glutamine amidotransferase